jgi:transposase
VQTQLGLLSGGEAGARTARINGIRTSGDTLLRRVVQAPEPQSEEVQHIGIDDWAWRKGRRYGTLLVNLDTRRPITLLPGRGQRSLAVWLKKHPEIRVVSRNRASAYAQAATQGAPQAVQVADRWHLLKNIGDALERVVYRYAAALRLVAKALAPSKPTVTTDSENESGDVRQPERLKQQRRQTRHTRWENVMKLHQLGHSQRSIARQTGLHRVTIRRWIQSGDYPEMASRPILPGLLTPWRHWLETRWREGHHNARHLWQEMTAEGFTG